MHSHHIHNHSIRHTLQILSRYWSQEVHPLYSSHGHCPGIDALSSHPQSLYQTYPTDIVSLLITIVHPLYSSHGHCPGIDALSLYTQSLYQTYPTDIVSLLITIGTSTLLLTRALSRYWCTLITSTITLSDIPYRYCLAIDHKKYIHSTPHTGIVPVLMHSHYIHNHSIRQSLYQTYPTDIVSLLITIGTSTLLLTRALSRYWCTLITSTITLSDIPYRYCLAIDHKKYIHSTPHTGIVPVLMHSHYIHNHSIRHTLQILSRYWSQ